MEPKEAEASGAHLVEDRPRAKKPFSRHEAEVSSDPEFTPAFLYVERGPGAGQLVPVPQGMLLIGRSSQAELRLQHPSVSRRHAQLNRRGERFYVRDLGSQNGTFLNKTRVGSEIELFPGDTLTLGNAILKLRGPMLKGEPRRAEPERRPSNPSVSAARPRKGSSLLSVALVAGAVGFGLAAVLIYALMKVPRSPTTSPLASVRTLTKATAGAPPTRAAATLPAPEPAVEREAAFDEPEAPQVDPPEERVAEAKAPNVPVRDEATAGGRTRRADNSLPRKTASDAQRVMQYYLNQKVSEALALAARGDDSALYRKLHGFERKLHAAAAAEKAGQTLRAVKLYKDALRLDRAIAGGEGRYAAYLEKRLAALSTKRPAVSKAAPSSRGGSTASDADRAAAQAADNAWED
jgi:pSer/pThr/pTyr-binding forkhead associated (FHA) protein